MSKEDFKQFVRKNPSLITKVNNNETTWQKLYDVYNLYGEDNEVWNNYITKKTYTNSADKDKAIKELVNLIKGIDMEKVRHGIEGVQKAISLIQDLGFGKSSTPTDNYEARSSFRHFDD